jgi:hypothetical protein
VLTVWEPVAALPFAGRAIAAPELEESIAAEARKVADDGATIAGSAGFEATSLLSGRSSSSKAPTRWTVWGQALQWLGEHDAAIGARERAFTVCRRQPMTLEAPDQARAIARRFGDTDVDFGRARPARRVLRLLATCR